MTRDPPDTSGRIRLSGPDTRVPLLAHGSTGYYPQGRGRAGSTAPSPTIRRSARLTQARTSGEIENGASGGLVGRAEYWARIALSKGWVEEWVQGAIYPSEMVFFLARCEQSNVASVIESGRQDGFSTAILGEYARRRGVRVFSIDYEQDADRAARCRERLAVYPELHLLRGDANTLIGQLVRQEAPRRTALLADGPKGFWALALMSAAAAQGSVTAIALHNLGPRQPATPYVEGLAPEPLYYEESLDNPGSAWRELKSAEDRFCAKSAQGALSHSSLGVMVLSDSVRHRLAWAIHPGFKLFQPPLVRLGWGLGLFRATGWLFSLSFRFLA